MIAGDWFITAVYYGETLLGVVGNYFWNYLILYLALRWQKISTTKKRRFAYTGIITAVGLLIDALYYEFTWGTPVKHSLPVPGIFETPGLNPGLELSTILIPMALAICWGLLFATALTLIMIPCIYAIMDDIAIKIFHHPTVLKNH